MGEHMLLLARRLRGRYDVSFLCRASSSLFDEAQRNCFAVWDMPPEYEALRRTVADLQPHIFHCHAGIGWEGHTGVRAAREAGIEAVLRTEHLPYLLTEPAQRDEYRRLFDMLDGLICVSHGARRSFERAELPAEKLNVVQNGIEPCSAAPKREELLTELGLSNGALLALTVGRMAEQKAHTYLLEAMPPLLESRPEAHLLLVGTGPLEEELQGQAERLGLGGHVHFLGRRSDVPRLMAACDLFVLPSLFEGLPLVALEAMSLGRPVVGTKVCGTEEAVRDGVTGRLVEPRNSRRLAEAMAEALGDPELRRRWGRAGQERVRTQFSAERMARETAAIYENMLSDTKRAAGGKLQAAR